MDSSQGSVVITGMGVISPIGCTLDEFWTSLMAGRSGLAPAQALPADSLDVPVVGEARGFTGAIEQFGPLEKTVQRSIKKSQKLMCREIEMGVAACQLALADAALSASNLEPDRSGITYGSDYILTRPEEFADGIMACRQDGQLQRQLWPTVGRERVNPLWLLKFLPNMPASHVAIFNDLRGPSNSITVREASNAVCFAEAAAAIRRGAADVMIVGSTGSRIEPLRYLHVRGQEPLASLRSDPTQMSRPFAADRDGIVLGEGAAAFVLERQDKAEARGARIYARLKTSATSSVGGGSLRQNIERATANVLSIATERCGELADFHVHAAGRGDVEGDAGEAAAVAAILGDRAAKVSVFAAKSYFGHLGAGSAAVELVASVLAIQHGQIPATLNSDTLDPNIKLKIRPEPQAAGTALVHLACSPQGQATAMVLEKV